MSEMGCAKEGYVKIKWGRNDRQNLHCILQEFAEDEKYLHPAPYLPCMCHAFILYLAFYLSKFVHT